MLWSKALNEITTWLIENQEVLLGYLTQFIIALVIFMISKITAKLIRSASQTIMVKKEMDPAVISFLSGIVYSTILVIGFIIAISYLGFNTASLVAMLGAAGLAIGLALKGSLSNFASGILLIAFKPFKSGDFVEVSGVSGLVENIHIFSTQLRTPDNKTVIIPNSAITGGSITNYSTKPTRRIDLVIGVSYNADLAKAKGILLELASNHEQVLNSEEITVGVSELADSSINIVLRPWVKTEDYWPVYFDLLEQIKLALDKAEIEIPYPQLSLHVNPKENHEN